MTFAQTSTFLALVAGSLVVLTVEGGAQKGGKGRQVDTPVTSTLGSGYRIQSDGQPAPYSNTDGVESIIQTSNTCCQDWELDTGSSSVRSIQLDFTDAIAGSRPDGSDPVAPFTVAPVHGRLIAQCHLVYAASFPGMLPGQVLDCPLLISFPIPGSSNTYWRVAMHTNQPDTDLARVECVAADITGKCSDWTITSDASNDGETKNVAKLLKISFKGNTPPQDYGSFYMTFSIRVTNP